MAFLRASDVSLGSTITCDVCIVGAGAAGIPLALELARSGLETVLLESNDQPQSCGDSPAGVSNLYAGEEGPFLQCTTSKVSPPPWLEESRKRTYGGSTNCWGATSIPLSPIDFEARSTVPGSGWPSGVGAELASRWYPAALPVIHLGRMEYFDIGYWTSRGYQDPFADGGYGLRTVIAQQAQSRFWKFQCVYGAELESTPHLRLLLDANLVSLDTDSSKVTLGQVVSKNGRDFFGVQARSYVLATGGIETVRLLFNADPEKFPRGLGNNKADLLGRLFMVHPLIDGAATVSSNSANFGGIFQNPPPPQQPNDVNIQVWASPTDEILKARGVGNLRVFLARAGSQTVVNLNWQQVASPESRLYPVAEIDRLGQRRIRLDWTLNGQDWKTASQGLDLVAKALDGMSGGAWKLTNRFDQERGKCDDWKPYAGYGSNGLWPGEHHMGATRMSDDPEGGIVDRNGRVHPVDNLYIASSSVFPAVGFANPTLTIIAMALRLADHLKTTLS